MSRTVALDSGDSRIPERSSQTRLLVSLRSTSAPMGLKAYRATQRMRRIGAARDRARYLRVYEFDAVGVEDANVFGLTASGWLGSPKAASNWLREEPGLRSSTGGFISA
jgi:hypothetical protein